MKQKYKILFSLFITIILVGFLLSQIGVKDFIRILDKINLTWFLFAFAFFILANFFRARRFKPLLKNQFNLFSLFNIVCIYDFFLNILPFRSGEFSYLYLINKSGRVKIGQNLSSLIVARFFDFWVISLFYFVSLYSVFKIKTQFFWQAFLYLAILFFLFLTLSLLVFFAHEKLNRLGEIILRKTFLKRFKISIFLQEKIRETLNAIQDLKSKELLLALVFNSLLIWLFFYFSSFFLVRALGLNLSFSQTIFVFSLPLFLSTVFVQGMAGFGTLEGSWTAGFIILGISKELAIASSFAIHGIILFYLIILAVFGFINLKRNFFA